MVLIPEGKEYRKQRVELKKERRDLREYQKFNDETFEFLKELQSDNKQVIIAFDNIFNPQKFEKNYSNYFSSLHISKEVKVASDSEFNTYEVNTTSEINSPRSFYDFLEAINKSDWIIGVEFPINFKREGELITSSFTMKVYRLNRESNSTEELSSK